MLLSPFVRKWFWIVKAELKLTYTLIFKSKFHFLASYITAVAALLECAFLVCPHLKLYLVLR